MSSATRDVNSTIMDDWNTAAMAIGLATSSMMYHRPSIHDRHRKPEATIKVHQLSRHSFTATVIVPMARVYERVRGTTRQQTLNRARWLRDNYWKYRH